MDTPTPDSVQTGLQKGRRSVPMFRTRIVYHPRPTISFTLLFSLLQRIKRNLVGEEGVGVVKDKDPTLEEIESSHTLGGVVTVVHT